MTSFIDPNASCHHHFGQPISLEPSGIPLRKSARSCAPCGSPSGHRRMKLARLGEHIVYFERSAISELKIIVMIG